MADNIKAKVLYLIESLHVGGAEELILITLKHLDRKQFLPVVYCLTQKGKIAEEIEEGLGIQVVELGQRCRLWNVGLIFVLMRIFRKEKPDILHTHLFFSNYFGRLAAIFVRIPRVIITEHGTYSNFKKFYHHLIDSVLSIFTYRIIVVSEAVKQYLLKYSWIVPQKIVVIHNTVNTEKLEKATLDDRRTIRKSLGFSDYEPVVGCISNLAPWKGQLVLLKAFSMMYKALPNLKLCIVGRDTIGFKRELESFSRKEGFLDRVYFLGERRDIAQLLRSFDIFAFPSLTEALGLALLEAMYSGLPVVASRTEGILEIIEDDFDGILVPPENPELLSQGIELLLKDKEKCTQLSKNARKKVIKLFSPDIYIRKTEAVYTGNN